jgi:hypothetical protein
MEEEQDYSDTISKTSKFNGAISQLYRLDALWKDTHIHSRSGEMEKWNWDLDRVWAELAGDFDDESPNNKNFEAINEEIGSLKGKYNKGEYNKLIFYNLYYAVLNKKEVFLRRLQNKLGKGTEYESEDDILE